MRALLLLVFASACSACMTIGFLNESTRIQEIRDRVAQRLQCYPNDGLYNDWVCWVKDSTLCVRTLTRESLINMTMAHSTRMYEPRWIVFDAPSCTMAQEVARLVETVYTIMPYLFWLVAETLECTLETHLSVERVSIDPDSNTLAIQLATLLTDDMYV